MFAAAILLVAAAVPTQASLAGLYEIRQMEMGGGLELGKDGRFRFAFDYGAASEQGEGEWTFDGKSVRLTSKPMPKAPMFELVRDDPAPTGQLSVTVEQEGFNWGGRIDAIATTAAGEQGLVTIATDGSVDSGGRVLSTIEPLVPVYGTPAGRFALTGERGHKLTLRFRANDLGRARFASEPLALDGDDLLMTRYDTKIRFVRVRP